MQQNFELFLLNKKRGTRVYLSDSCEDNIESLIYQRRGNPRKIIYFKIVIAKLTRYKISGNDKIPAELI
jgi:hypothetical protein